MDHVRAAFALLIVAVGLGYCYPGSAEESNSDTQTRKFELTATMIAKPQLSREEIDPVAVGVAPQVAPPIPAQLPPQSQAPQAVTDPAAVARLAALASQARIAAIPPRQENEDAPGAFMTEYNVDWSRWVSVTADRWFYVLRSAEYQLGMQFATPRPALIQYTCYADGSIGNVILKQSSGVPAYDRLQIASLLQSMPTPPFPAGTHRKSITLVQGWESHPKQPGERDFQPGSFGRNFPMEKVRKWCAGL